MYSKTLVFIDLILQKYKNEKNIAEAISFYFSYNFNSICLQTHIIILKIIDR